MNSTAIEQPAVSSGRRIIDGVTMFVVTALSLFLLVYLGFAEAKRVYTQLQTDKMAAQGRTVQGAIENYLRAGLPLRQFAGFATLAEPVIQGIEELDALAVYDEAGRQVFFAIDKKLPELPEPPSTVKHPGQELRTHSGATHIQIVLPLRTRFETAGSLLVVTSVKPMMTRLQGSFNLLLFGAVVLSAIFAITVVIGAPYLGRSKVPWLQIGYAASFTIMAGLVVLTLVSLYAEGVQNKARGSAVGLGGRLRDVLEFNLRFRDFDGIDRVLIEHRKVTPEIRDLALVAADNVLFATDPSRNGKPWTSDPSVFEYKHALGDSQDGRRVALIVTTPKSLVYQEVERSVRNFAALFIATGFLAGLFLQVASSMQNLRAGPSADPGSKRPDYTEEGALILVKPIFFVGVFIEHLTYSFLPRLMQDVAADSGVSVGFATAPFIAYYLCFALSLIPAGHLSERFGPRALIWSGLVVASFSLLALLIPAHLAVVACMRGLAGIGQGMLFIGIQAYILAVASAEKKTQANAIIVFGFQGGMISGMAIGSLLVTNLLPAGIFILCGTLGLAAAVYSAVLIPDAAQRMRRSETLRSAVEDVALNLRKVVRSAEFLKAIGCIGIPAKAILTGAVTFGLPLILAHEGYRQEEIGQIIMVYGIGVVVASGYVSRIVDQRGSAQLILFFGALLSAIGLAFTAVMGTHGLGTSAYGTAVVVAGTFIIGIAHGFINAPVVTHVTQSRLAAEIGATPVAASYRFLERLGHVVGPLVVGQLFLMWGQTPYVFAYLGLIVASLGVLFICGTRPNFRLETREAFGR